MGSGLPKYIMELQLKGIHTCPSESIVVQEPVQPSGHLRMLIKCVLSKGQQRFLISISSDADIITLESILFGYNIISKQQKFMMTYLSI